MRHDIHQRREGRAVLGWQEQRPEVKPPAEAHKLPVRRQPCPIDSRQVHQQRQGISWGAASGPGHPRGVQQGSGEACVGVGVEGGEVEQRGEDGADGGVVAQDGLCHPGKVKGGWDGAVGGAGGAGGGGCEQVQGQLYAGGLAPGGRGGRGGLSRRGGGRWLGGWFGSGWLGCRGGGGRGCCAARCEYGGLQLVLAGGGTGGGRGGGRVAVAVAWAGEQGAGDAGQGMGRCPSVDRSRSWWKGPSP